MTIQEYIKVCKKFEGGLSKDKADSASAHPCPTPYKGVSGYHTNKGITYPVWVSMFGIENDERFFIMNDEDWFKIFDKLYFSKVRGHEFKSLNCAALVVGMAWGSGLKQAILTLQRAISNLGNNIPVDGVIGPKTIAAANLIEPVILFDELMRLRIKFFNEIGAPGKTNNKFLKGWLNRAEAYRLNFRPTQDN